jgi:protein ImuB
MGTIIMIFACIHIPAYVVQASIRCEPEPRRLAWATRPVAVFAGPESLPRIVACNEPAKLAGIEVGITKVQAAQCPGIILRKRDSRKEQLGQEAILNCASAFSPRIESTGPGIVTLDITGMERVFGPAPKLLRLLAEHVSKIGLEANVATASNPDTALIAARGFAGTHVIAVGKEAECLAQLPVDVLGLSEVQAEILDSWGIRKCRDLALLPPVPLTERLGQTGLHLQRLARGEVHRTLVPADPPTTFRERVEFEDAVSDLESLAFALDRLLHHICALLKGRSLATDELILTLGLEIYEDRDVNKELTTSTQTTSARHLKLPVSTQDEVVLSKLLQLELEQHRPNGAVKSVTVEARPARHRVTQAGLFAALAPEPAKLEIMLARIRGVVGEADEHGRALVGSPEVPDSHQPDDFRMLPFSTQEIKSVSDANSQPACVTMSIFRPCLAAHVLCRSGKPAHISFAEFKCPIICLAGPWTTSGNWWKKEEEWRREEWDVAIQLREGIGLYRIFRDLRQNAWFVEGLYD